MKTEVLLSVEEEMDAGQVNPANAYSRTVHELCLSRPVHTSCKNPLWLLPLPSLCSYTSVLENPHLFL